MWGLRQERVPNTSSKLSWFWSGAVWFGEDGGEVVEGVGEAEGELQQRPGVMLNEVKHLILVQPAETFKGIRFFASLRMTTPRLPAAGKLRMTIRIE